MDNLFHLTINRQDACSTINGRSEIARYLIRRAGACAVPRMKIRKQASRHGAISHYQHQ